MKIRFITTLSFALAAVSAPALAHDPSLHQKDGAPPACARMKNMDLSKMEPNDPVLKAMQLQCQDSSTDDDEDSDSHDHAMTIAPGPGTGASSAPDAAKP